MAYVPISGSVPQFQRNAAGAAANGYYLKGYAAGTTTPLSMGVDSTPSSTIAKCALNSRGEPISNDSDETTVFIPYFNAAYKLVLYVNSTDADNNTTANAVWVVDNLSGQFDAEKITYQQDGTSTAVDLDDYLNSQVYETVSDMVADSTLVVGQRVRTLGYTTIGDGGGNDYQIVAAATGTADGGTYIDLATHQAKGLFPGGDINVTQYGAVGDGVVDDYTAIQAAIDVVEATALAAQVPGTLLVPAGEYLIDTGLVIDSSLISIKGSAALWQFTNLGVNADAITLNSEGIGYAGGAYYTATNYIEGIRFKGREGASEGAFPITGQELNCFKIEKGPTQILFGYEIRNCVINNFTISVEIGDEAWGTTFRNCNFAFNQTNYYAPSGIAASGAKFLFDGCIFQNGKTCFNIENLQGTTYVSGCNIEAMTDNFFYLNGGEFYITGCHIEQANSHTTSYFIRRDSAVNVGVLAYASVANTLFIAKGTRTVPMFDLSGVVSWKFTGGDILTGQSTYTTGSYFESDGGGAAGGSLTILGALFEKGVGSVDVYGGVDSLIDITAWWNKTPSQRNTLWFPAFPAALGTATPDTQNLETYEEGAWTPTAVSVTETGSPIYTGSYTRIGNMVFGTLTIDPNGGTTAMTAGTSRFTGIPYAIKTGTGFAASCISDTTVDAGAGRVEGASVYPPTWTADGVKRYVTFQYTANV